MKKHPLREEYPWEEFWADVLAYGLVIQPPASGMGNAHLLRAGFSAADDPRFILRHAVADYYFRNSTGLEEYGIAIPPDAFTQEDIRAIYHAYMECAPGAEPPIDRVVDLCHLYRSRHKPETES